VRVALRDTGFGMSEETAARALEPFFTTKDVGKGSGLGLSSIYGFARQSGGGVRIQTAPGKGTKVSIFLPRCESLPVDAPGHQQDEEAMGRQETVLLVEDEPDVRGFATMALENVNYRVIPVGAAEPAMKVLRENKEKIDVLFTDIVLPGDMDGWGLAEAARDLHPELKIILTSGNWELAGKSPPKAVSDAAVLQKPYSHQELAQIIQSAINPVAIK
ncbi:MAG: response regulator, partial [Alphaproteobacteria bacterium]